MNYINTKKQKQKTNSHSYQLGDLEPQIMLS